MATSGEGTGRSSSHWCRIATRASCKKQHAGQWNAPPFFATQEGMHVIKSLRLTIHRPLGPQNNGATPRRASQTREQRSAALRKDSGAGHKQC